jgi:hypothetical protein
MPFSNMPWWMRLYQPRTATGNESLPPPASTGDPFNTPNVPAGPPGFGGPGSYPIATPAPSETFNPVEPDILPGNEAAPTGPSTVGGLLPDTPNLFPPGGGYPSTTAGAPPMGTPSMGQGDRGDDSGRVPGVDLSIMDKANMALKNLGLPPLSTNFNMFGGLPPGFTEGNRFGGGAPTFTGPGFTGPGWSPGGSIFGGTLSPTGWVAGGGNFNNQGGVVNMGLGGSRYFGPRVSSGGQFVRFGPMAPPIPYSQWVSMGKPGGAPPGGRLGGSGSGRNPVASMQFGGVAGEDDFYSNIGAATYGAGRKVEDQAHNVFSALGELGKYLGSQPTTNPSFQPMAGERPALQMPGLNRSMSGLVKWLTDPSDRPAPDGRMAGRGWGIDNPDFPPWAPRPGPWPLKQEPPDSGMFRPELYDQRSSGSMLADIGFRDVPRYNDQTPLYLRSIGPYNTPSNKLMPEVYDTRASGAMLAKNTDTVPAMLTPGEVVLDKRQQQAVMPVPGRENMLLPNQRARLAKRMWT